MRVRVVLSLALVLGVAAACGGDDDDGAVPGGGPAVTLTVTEAGHNLATAGYVVPTGEAVEVRFVNERDAAADIELFVAPAEHPTGDPRPDGVEAADARTLDAGADETVELTFAEAGEYRAAIDPVSADPTGVVAGGGTFTVGDG